jgi:hypothetical protein
VICANHGLHEAEHGRDIDISIETRKGQFSWHALQAKVIRKNGRYKDLKKKSREEFQWEKLTRLMAGTGCVAQYLLYNGIKGFTEQFTDICGGPHNEKLYGCSLVFVKDVEKFITEHPGRNPSFQDFHDGLAQPWHVLVCCALVRSDNLYSFDQVSAALDEYTPMTQNANIVRPANLDRPPAENRNAIVSASESSGWSPYYRSIIRTTESLNDPSALL